MRPDRVNLINNKRKEYTMKYKVKDVESGKIHLWSVDQIVEEINRDRSGTWKPYNRTDWKEGWNHWVEGECFEIVD